MKTTRWSGIGLCIVFGAIAVFALLIVFAESGLASARLAPLTPGLAISPGYSVDVDPGDVVDYVHTITNTGTSDAIYGFQLSASEGWSAQFFTAAYPGGTALLPLPLQAGESMTLGVRLTVPAEVAGGVLNTTTVTVSVFYESMFYLAKAVDDVAAVRSVTRYTYIYLPVVMRRYAPLTNGDFSNGLAGWTQSGVLGSSIAYDPNQPSNVVALLGNRGYACWNGVPLGYGGIQQYFVAPRAPAGQSVHIFFRYRIYTNDRNVGLTDKYDTFDVLVNGVLKLRDANEIYFDECNVPPYDMGWRAGDINLGEGGVGITLALEVHNRADQFYNTYVYVDDVRIVIQ
ncbi:MAG TPA: hypothetical protein PKZ84_01935 [Anaerolineae bacterium]|nr:hypothetical protein [Anaerolineae bacterium]HQI83659.1 hypothetical protein [Anaerolineae bacterium]